MKQHTKTALLILALAGLTAGALLLFLESDVPPTAPTGAPNPESTISVAPPLDMSPRVPGLSRAEQPTRRNPLDIHVSLRHAEVPIPHGAYVGMQLRGSEKDMPGGGVLLSHVDGGWEILEIVPKDGSAPVIEADQGTSGLTLVWTDMPPGSWRATAFWNNPSTSHRAATPWRTLEGPEDAHLELVLSDTSTEGRLRVAVTQRGTRIPDVPVEVIAKDARVASSSTGGDGVTDTLQVPTSAPLQVNVGAWAGTALLGQAAPVEVPPLEAGQSATVTLVLPPAWPVELVCEDSRGVRLACDLALWIRRGDAWMPVDVTHHLRRAEGEEDPAPPDVWHGFLPAGTYRAALAPREGYATVSGTWDVQALDGDRPQRLVLVAKDGGTVVRVHLQDADGTPIRPLVNLNRVAATPETTDFAILRPDASGWATSRPLRPGPYRLLAWTAGWAQDLEVPDQTTAVYELRLPPPIDTRAEGAITGRVTTPDGRGWRGGTVLVRAAGASWSRIVSCDGDGGFQVPHLAPGRWHVHAMGRHLHHPPTGPAHRTVIVQGGTPVVLHLKVPIR